MRYSLALCIVAIVVFAPCAAAQEVSIERGRYLSIIGGCHDCHTEGYRQSGGKIDPAKALKGSMVGFQGPWGTSYPQNLRLFAGDKSEDNFLLIIRTGEFNPPMPWFNLQAMTEADQRSLYRYIRSLGEPGENAPPFAPPGARINTPYIVFDPPQPPPPCTRDLDCGVGLICGTSEPRTCEKR